MRSNKPSTSRHRSFTTVQVKTLTLKVRRRLELKANRMGKTKITIRPRGRIQHQSSQEAGFLSPTAAVLKKASETNEEIEVVVQRKNECNKCGFYYSPQ